MTPSAPSVLDGIATLVDQNLLRAEEGPDGEPRYAMLETVREYGLERLEASGEAERIRRAKADWCLALAEQADLWGFPSDEAAWLDRLSVELGNLRAALAWADERGQAETALRLAAALARFWRVRGHLTEGRQALERALDNSRGDRTSLRVKALLGTAVITIAQGDYARTATRFEEALALAQDLQSPADVARALHLRGVAMLDQGRFAEATALIERAQGFYREGDAEGWRALSLSHLGAAVANQGDLGRAIALWTEALALQGDDPAGWTAAHALQHLGSALSTRGDYRAAAQHYHRSLMLWQALGDAWYIATCVTALAGVAAERGRADLAARMLGAADALRESIGATLRPRERGTLDRAVAAARTALGTDAFAAAWAEGRATTLAEVIAAAARVEETIAADERADVDAAARAGLTSRELEVLRLMAEGRRDREIAALLFVSHRTVTSHVTNIFAKLGVTSRSAAAVHALRHGLI